MLPTGVAAPAFRAESTQGEIELNSRLERGPVVLYFFPKANTSG
jgi:peroxiredoxin